MKRDFFNNNYINQTIKTKLNDFFNNRSYAQYAYVVMNKRDPTKIIIINNYPSWGEVYLKHNYQLIDPVIITALKRVEDFAWDEKIIVSSKVSLPKIFNASKQYNISSGHSFIVHDYRNNLALLSIFNELNGDEFKEKIKRDQYLLQALLIEVHQTMLCLYQSVDTNIIPIISKRENAILYWSSIGKTSQEIALILGIKNSTVKFHIRNINTKFGVSNTKHAIKLAVELQLINPVIHE